MGALVTATAVPSVGSLDVDGNDGVANVLVGDASANKHGIEVEVALADTEKDEDYRLTYELLDAAGNPVSGIALEDASGTVPSGFTADTAEPDADPFTVYLVPPVDTPLGEYRVRVSLAGRASGQLVFGNDYGATTSAPFDLRVFSGVADSGSAIDPYQRDARTRITGITVSQPWRVVGTAAPFVEVTLDLEAFRYDGDSGAGTVDLPVRVSATLTDADGTQTTARLGTDPAALAATAAVTVPGLAAVGISSVSPATVTTTTPTLYLEPETLADFDFLAGPVELAFALEHEEIADPQFYQAGVGAETSEPLLFLDGTLAFGDVATVLTGLTALGPLPTGGDLGEGVTTFATSLTNAQGQYKDSHTYGPTPLDVTIHADGTASVRAASTTTLVPASLPDEGRLGGVTYRRGILTLDATGARMAGGEVRLPHGVGWVAVGTGREEDNLLSGWMEWAGGTVVLDDQLAPEAASYDLVAPASGGGTTDFWLVEESKPLRWSASKLLWTTGTGGGDPPFSFTAGAGVSGAPPVESTHGDEWDLLEVMALDAVDAGNSAALAWAERRSNRAYLREVLPAADLAVTLGLDARGGGSLSAQLALAPRPLRDPDNFAYLRPHFPSGTAIRWDTGGSSGAFLSADRFVDGFLDGITSVTLDYRRASLNGCNTLAEATLEVAPDSQRLFLTPDGGLASASVTWVTSSPTLSWGATDPGSGVQAVHEVSGWTDPNASFATAGLSLVPAGEEGWDYDSLSAPEPFAVATLLQTGFRESGGTWVEERPLTAGYEKGTGDYPGLNLRVAATSGSIEGSSVVGGELIPASGTYGLRDNAKYYVRYGGVSGTHDVDASSFAGQQVPIYGYEMEFQYFGLAYQDNLNGERDLGSTVTGELAFTSGPSAGLQLPFAELAIDGDGQLLSADLTLSPGDLPVPIAHWGGGLSPRSFRFASDGACNGARLLTLGVEGYASAIPSPLQGFLAFSSTKVPSGSSVLGNLVSLDDAAAFGVRPRLRLPTRIQLTGPATEVGGATTYQRYELTPVADAYYNVYQSASEPGFLSFPAKLDVAFFEDLSVHVRMAASSSVADPGLDGLSTVYLSGGWTDAGEDFWSDPEGFDGAHTGYDSGSGRDPYWEENHTIPANAIHARQELFGIVSLDYVVEWEPTRRMFLAPKEEADLLVLNAFHKLDYLTPESANITFGAKAEVDGLPDLNLGTLAFNAVDAATGIASSLRAAAENPIGEVLDEGFAKVNELVEAAPYAVFDRVYELSLSGVLDGSYYLDAGVAVPFSSGPLIEEVRGLLVDTAEQAEAAFEAELSNRVDAFFDKTSPDWLFASLAEAMAAVDRADSLAGQVQARLLEAQNAIRSVTSVAARVDGASLSTGDLEALFDAVQGGGGTVTIPWNDFKNATLDVAEAQFEKANGSLPPYTYSLYRGLLAPPVAESVELVTGDLGVDLGAGAVFQPLEGDLSFDPTVLARLLASLVVQTAREANLPDSVLEIADLEGLSVEFLPEIDADFGPTLRAIRSTLLQIDEILQELLDQTGAARQLLAEIEDLLNTTNGTVETAFATMSTEVKTALYEKIRLWRTFDISLLEAAEFDATLAAEFEAEFQAFFQAEFRAVLFESPVVIDLQQALRQHIQDLQAGVRAQIDAVFAQLETAVRDQLTGLLANLDLGIDASLFSPFDEFAGYGEIDGYLSLLGDRADLLRLDAYLDLQAPKSMKFHGFFQLKALRSQGLGGCDYGGEEATEVTLGAIDMPFEWLSPDLRMDVETSFSFSSGSGLPVPRGFGGGFAMTSGELSYETFAITDLGAGAAFGADENYLAARVGLRLRDYTMQGGVFFGRACDVEPVAIAHEQTADLLWNDGGGSFTGALAYGNASIPISEALGVPSSCFFRISAGVGAGAFYFAEGPTYGGIMDVSASGEALCAVSVKGEVSMVGAKQGGELRYDGRGRISGKAGACPLCVKFGKNVGIQYQSHQWSIDL